MKKLFLLTLITIAACGLGLNAAPKARVAPGTPAPGKWEISPRVLVEGTEVPSLQIRYVHTGDDLKPGEGFHMFLEKISVASLFHCPMSETVELVPYKGDLPKINFKVGPVTGVGYRELDIIFPNGLKKGDSFAIALGNKQPDGSIKALITPFPMTNLGLPIYTRDAKGKQTDWFDAGWFDKIPHCDIVPGPASDMRVFLPSLVQAGKPFPLRIAVTDGLDSRATPFFTGKLTIKAENPGINGLPASVTLDEKDSSYKEVPGLTINKPGVYRVSVTMPGGKTVESNPVVVRNEPVQPVYWGNIHNHGQYSECFGMDNDWFYTVARYVSGMDFVALSDHIAVMPGARGEGGRLYKWRTGKTITGIDAWKDTIATSDKWNDPKGGFVSITGYEAGGVDPGHFNVYTADVTMDNMDTIFATSRSTPYVREVRNVVEKAPSALYIWHLHALPGDWTIAEDNALDGDGTLLSPCIEIYSDWGSSFLAFNKDKVDNDKPESKFGGIRNAVMRPALWALGQGIKFGCIGDSDSHTGQPGRRVIGSPALVHNHPVGLTAVMTADFSRQGLINGYKDRSVYATTGEHIFLDFKINGAGMGKELATDDPLSIFIQVAGTDEIAQVVLWNGLKKIATATPNTRDTIQTFKLPAPDYTQQKAYVVEVTQKDGQMAWSSPIWVSKAAAPDLAWEKRDDGLYLINKGKAAATNIEIGYSPAEHPFTKPSIKGLPDMKTPDSGYLWTDRRDDHTVFLHYRWHGDKPLNVTMLTPGITCDPKNDTSRNSSWGRSTMTTTGANNHELTYRLEFDTSRKQGNSKQDFCPGMSWIMRTDTDKPAQVVLRFDREVTTYMNDQPVKTNILRVPLNGLTKNGTLTITTVPKLAPGESYKVTGEKGNWSADPNNKIAESDEGNNLYQVK